MVSAINTIITTAPPMRKRVSELWNSASIEVSNRLRSVPAVRLLHLPGVEPHGESGFWVWEDLKCDVFMTTCTLT
jgi:hypothetical protein